MQFKNNCTCNSQITLGFASCNYLTVTGTIILKLHSNVCDYLYKLWNIIEIQESLIFDHYTYLSLSKFVTKRACPLNQCIGNHITTMVVQEVVNMGFSKQKLSLLFDELLNNCK